MNYPSQMKMFSGYKPHTYTQTHSNNWKKLIHCLPQNFYSLFQSVLCEEANMIV